MKYDELLIEADHIGLTVKEKPLKGNDGRIYGKRIAIRNDIKTNIHKSCVLAEELGHYYTTSGDILDQSSVNNRKQEHRARIWAYNKMIGLSGIISAYKTGCNNIYDMADYLDVTEDFLQEALSCYRSKYGTYTKIDNYVIYFEPSLGVFKLI